MNKRLIQFVRIIFSSLIFVQIIFISIETVQTVAQTPIWEKDGKLLSQIQAVSHVFNDLRLVGMFNDTDYMLKSATDPSSSTGS